jgi:hypothetical protein
MRFRAPVNLSEETKLGGSHEPSSHGLLRPRFSNKRKHYRRFLSFKLDKTLIAKRYMFAFIKKIYLIETFCVITTFFFLLYLNDPNDLLARHFRLPSVESLSQAIIALIRVPSGSGYPYVNRNETQESLDP